MCNKPGYARRIRRIHHTQRIIQKRAREGWALGYVRGYYNWRPYKDCCYDERYGVHRMYLLLGVPCPCTQRYYNGHYWVSMHVISRERNAPTNILADHLSCASTCPCKMCDRDDKPRDYFGRLSAIEQVEEYYGDSETTTD